MYNELTDKNIISSGRSLIQKFNDTIIIILTKYKILRVTRNFSKTQNDTVQFDM